MEITSSIWLISLIALTAGALIGVLAYRLFAPSVKQAERVRSELQEARDELGSYRDNVNEHFDKTAELVNDLTQNYVKVYQHLAEGAQTLGDGKRFDNLLEQQSGKVSIAVDDDAITPAASAGAAVVDAGVPPAAGDETVAVEAVAAAEVAEVPAAGAPEAVASAEPVAAESEPDGETDDRQPAREAQRPEEPLEPVLNVEALGEAIAKSDREGDDDRADAVPESKRETEVRTTAH